MADETGEFLSSLARLVTAEPPRISEEEALQHLQNTINVAKVKLDEHKVSEPTKLNRILAAQDLEATVSLASSSGCTINELRQIRLIRHDGDLTVEVGEGDRRSVGRFSLTEERPLDGSPQFLFNQLGRLAKRIANAPPDCKWVAESTPEELLERGKRSLGLIGGKSWTIVKIRLKDAKGEIFLTDRSRAFFADFSKWHESICKLVTE